MASKQIVFALITFLHDLFTVIWIGGLFSLVVVVAPAARGALGMGPETKKLMAAIQKRLSTLVYLSIVVLAITGLLMSMRVTAFQGLLSFANTYSTVLSIKHLVYLAMIAVALVRSLALGRKVSGPSVMGPAAAKQEKAKMALSVLNLALGIVTLLLSGFAAALSAGKPPL